MDLTSTSHPLAHDLTELVEQNRDLWEVFRGQGVFLTGGTGFFGTWLLEAFAWANQVLGLGTEVLVLSRDPDAFLKKCPHLAQARIRFQKGDIGSFEFPRGEFPLIIHAATAASARLNEEEPLVMFDQIVQGTRRVLEFARHCGAKKFLLTSSGAVYGRQPSDTLNVSEDFKGGPDPLDPRSAYSEAKRAAEFLCATYARIHGFDSLIARGFAFVGPHLPLDNHLAIGNFIADGLAGRNIRIGGDGMPYRSYFYASELVVWLLTILQKGQSCRAYNVGSEDGRPLSEIADAVRLQFGGTIGVQIAGVSNPARPLDRYVPSVARAREELGLVQKIPLEEAIARTVRYYRAMGAGTGLVRGER